MTATFHNTWTFIRNLTLFSVISLNALASDLTSTQLSTAKQLISQAKNSPLGYEIVESLTTEIGPRLAGSEAEKRARNWAKKLGQKLNFDKVWIEPFSIPFWQRGHLHIALTQPYPQFIHGTALGGAAPSSKTIRADVVYFRDLAALSQAEEGSLTGKIAFIDGDKVVKSQVGAGYAPANMRRRIGWQHAQRAKAEALLVRSVGLSSHRFAHTGMMRSDQQQWADIPVIAISNPDADQFRRLHRLQKPLAVSLYSESKWRGEGESGNVIFDLTGSEKSDEIILIGAHLDSWDLGTGAIDDGAGVAIVTAAAKLIANLPTRPKRTIRVVLFGAEEVGLLGAREYVAKHKHNLANHLLATESDFGAQNIWQLVSNLNPQGTAVVDKISEVLMPIGIIRGPADVVGGGPDIIPFVEQGVPTIRLNQNGRDYFDLHHTPDDTLDKIDPEELAQNIAAYAATIYLLADTSADLRYQTR